VRVSWASPLGAQRSSPDILPLPLIQESAHRRALRTPNILDSQSRRLIDLPSETGPELPAYSGRSWAAQLAAGQLLGAPTSGGARPVHVDEGPGLDPRVDRLDAREQGLQQLVGRALLAPDDGGGFARGQLVEIADGSSLRRDRDGRRVLAAQRELCELGQVSGERLDSGAEGGRPVRAPAPGGFLVQALRQLDTRGVDCAHRDAFPRGLEPAAVVSRKSMPSLPARQADASVTVGLAHVLSSIAAIDACAVEGLESISRP